MGGSCAKERNAELVEQRRREREQRLGIYHNPNHPNNVPPQPQLLPQQMWVRPSPHHHHHGGGGGRSTSGQPMPVGFRPMPLAMTGRPPTPLGDVRRGSGRALPLPLPPPPFSSSPPPSLEQSRDGVNRAPNSGGGFVSPAVLKPIVLQALNDLCAIELQARVQIINEEMYFVNDLLWELERLHELETYRAASRELFALEAKSRASMFDQETHERHLLLQWIGELYEEVRLTEIIRHTQALHSSSVPASARSSPARSRMERSAGLTWTDAAPRPKTPPTGIQRSPVRREGAAGRQTDATPKLSTLLQDRLVSQDEEALNAKISRQRGLIESTRSLYRPTDVPSPVTVAPLRPAPVVPVTPIRAAAEYSGGAVPLARFSVPDQLALREASFTATRNRLSALAHYQ